MAETGHISAASCTQSYSSCGTGSTITCAYPSSQTAKISGPLAVLFTLDTPCGHDRDATDRWARVDVEHDGQVAPCLGPRASVQRLTSASDLPETPPLIPATVS